MSSEWGLLRSGVRLGLVARGLILGSGLAASLILARLLPREELGAYYLLLHLSLAGSLLACCGLDTSLQRFLAVLSGASEWRGLRALLARAALLASGGFVLLAGVLALAWAPLTSRLESPALAALLPAVLALVGLGVAEQLASVYFRATGRMGAGIFLLQLPKQLFFLLALIGLAVFGMGHALGEVAVLRAAMAGLATGAALFLLVRDLRARTRKSATQLRQASAPMASSPPAASAPGLGELARVSAPMLAHGLAAHLLFTADLWFLGFTLGPGEVAVYGSVGRVAMLVGVFLTIINVVMPPLLARLYAEGRRECIEGLMRRAATLSSCAAVSLALALFAGGPGLLRLAFGQGFESGFLPLLILAAGQLASVCAGSPGWLLQMSGHQVVLMRITFLGLAANLVLNLVGVRLAGSSGVAAATALTMVGQNLAMVRAARKSLGVRTYAYLNPLPTLKALGP